MGAAVLTGVASGIQGIRLAKQAPDGAVAVKTGTVPSSETPEKGAGIQRTLGTLAPALSSTSSPTRRSARCSQQADR